MVDEAESCENVSGQAKCRDFRILELGVRKY